MFDRTLAYSCIIIALLCLAALFWSIHRFFPGPEALPHRLRSGFVGNALVRFNRNWNGGMGKMEFAGTPIFLATCLIIAWFVHGSWSWNS